MRAWPSMRLLSEALPGVNSFPEIAVVFLPHENRLIPMFKQIPTGATECIHSQGR